MNSSQGGVLIGIHLVEGAGACDDRLVTAFDQSEISDYFVKDALGLFQLEEEIVSMHDGNDGNSRGGVVIVCACAFTEQSSHLFVKVFVGPDLSCGDEVEAGI